MSSRDSILGDIDPLDVEALDWVVRLTVGQLSDSDREAFERWRTTSEDHDRAFAEASALGGYVRRIPLPVGPDGFADTDEPNTDRSNNVLPFTAPPPTPGMSRRAFIGGGGAIAASITGGLMVANPPLGLWPSLSELMADVRTDAGERRSFSPIAGVDVELNSRSSASRTDGGNGLDLVHGEVFISVNEADGPFRVKAGGGIVTAEHASFNVQSFGGELCVTCSGGSVSVLWEERSETLTAGREFVFGSDGELREREADTFVRLAWRRGLLILRRTPVSEAIPQINRYFPGRLVLTDGLKSSWPVTGVFHIDQIHVAVVQLQRLLNVEATHLPAGVVLLG